VGDDIKLVFYENINGTDDPAPGSSYLGGYLTTVQALDQWNVYVLPDPVWFNGPTGDAIIGVIGLEVPGTSYWPASIDQTASQHRSWAGWWNTSPPPDPPLLPPDADWTNIDAYFPGNWMVRGYGYVLIDVIPWLSEDPMEGTVDPGECVVVNVTFDSTGLELGTYTGSLNVESNDPDTPIINIPVTLTVGLPVADLAVTKTASADEVRVGEMITYTLVVSNAGPQDAMGVTLVDTLPELVSFVWASDGCTELEGVVTCDIGDLAMDEDVTLYIVVSADVAGLATNMAEVPVPADYEDPDLENNMAEVDIMISPAIHPFYLPLVQKY